MHLLHILYLYNLYSTDCTEKKLPISESNEKQCIAHLKYIQQPIFIH